MDNYDRQNSHEGIWCFHQGPPVTFGSDRQAFFGLMPDK